MKTIKEANKNIASIWRRPQPVEAVYRPMKFLLHTVVDDGLLLYNVVTSEMVLLDDAEREFIEKLPEMYVKEMDELIARHFLVKEDFDENKSVKELRELLKKIGTSKRISGFTILPTTECNARCYYCFESDHKRCTLTKEMADDVVDYIIDKSKGESVEIGWFGGEPLVASNRIAQICSSLKQKGVKFKSSMVSNAYLFDEELARVAKNEWNLAQIQITLDGTEKVYNETKAYILPKDNPYLRVLRNIQYLLDNGIAVNIRLNVTDKNFDDLKDLIDVLAKRFGGKKGFTCYSHAVYEGVGYEPLKYLDREHVDIDTASLDAMLRERKLLGHLSQLPSLRAIHCMADNDSCRLIYPDGLIGKCENMSSADAIGDIYSDITDNEKDTWYKTIEQPEYCFDCCLFPNCFDLKACPESGTCSPTKVNWKIDRYTELMRVRYLRYAQEGSSNRVEDTTLQECES